MNSLRVVDEESGVSLSNIPVMPNIGPLIGRPKAEGQIGYVMLLNEGCRVRPGSQITVILDTFRQEHVEVQ